MTAVAVWGRLLDKFGRPAQNAGEAELAGSQGRVSALSARRKTRREHPLVGRSEGEGGIRRSRRDAGAELRHPLGFRPTAAGPPNRKPQEMRKLRMRWKW
ncbi:Hypothetical protein NTJ_04313 [Nesidiocoris tenuis]|uniref:Uncharacterized protein n=1 Tax=Nesidiocoris tenuis TaxID=355587 RepID=A0ABN7AGX2_9HEMI|nr:Hypothetical protein NTJ_04313 [Nesidiocoris tenuis]